MADTASEHDVVDDIVGHLRGSGFVVEPALGGSYVVRSYRGTAFPLVPVLTVPPVLVEEYLDDLRRRLSDEPDPIGEALSLTKIHLVEELATDHGDGLNYVRSLGFRRKRGKVEFFVDQEIPLPGHRRPSEPEWEWRAERPGGQR